MIPAAHGALPSGACPDPEQLAAHIDGGLPRAERAILDRHLVECADCRDVIAAAVAIRNEMGGGVAPAKRRMWWIGLGATVMTAAAIVLIVRLGLGAGIDWTPLVTAGPTRAIEPRVSVMAGYSAPPVGILGAAATRELSGDARLAIGRIEKAAADQPTAQTLQDLGLARLLTGDTAGSVDALKRAAASAPSAAVLSDLAAALFADAARRGTAGALDEARMVAARAVDARGSYAPALFNAALIAERSGPARSALVAWERYLRADPSSPWAGEARQRLARLR